jgi:hypothetical protein
MKLTSNILQETIDAGYANEGFINVNDTQSVVFDNPLYFAL